MRVQILLLSSLLALAGCTSPSYDTGDDHSSDTAPSTGSSHDYLGDEAEPSADLDELPPYDPDISPDDFVAGIDNPYMPMIPGATWTYYVGYEPESDDEDEAGDDDEDEFCDDEDEVEDDEEEEAEEEDEDECLEGLSGVLYEERIEVVVLDETRTINGVEATVVRDTVYDPEGNLIEDTFDWYAQDKDGNVWYLGEDTCEYEDNECVTKAGSFEWGIDGAKPGILMHGSPEPGGPYYQEFYKGEAVDRGMVLAVGETFDTQLGRFSDTVFTENWNPLHSDEFEHQVNVHGIGSVITYLYETDTGELGEVEMLVAYDVPGFGADSIV